MRSNIAETSFKQAMIWLKYEKKDLKADISGEKETLYEE